MTVYGYAGSKGLWNADSESYQNVTVPRWPVDVVPASGSDGHADLVDPISGIVHSFFKLKYIDGKWVASQYTWTKLKGRGWGDSAHYFQGSRATGVASIAGIIRKHEVNNGDSMYRHALAMSLTFNALSPNPAYTFPATSADSNAATTNTGAIPQGALMMLPASFNTAEILNPDLRKVAETLKVYGAYVVDRNYGTPFVIYVENGAGFNLHKNGWDGRVGTDLHKIRQALRQVVGASQWVDGNGQAIALNKNLNIMSMRGTWRVQEGSTQGVYDSWAQSISFPSRSVRTVQYSTSSRNLHPVSWALPAAGTSYQLTARTTGGAKLRFQIMDKALGTTVYDSGELQNGQITNFTWPVANYSFRIYAISGVGQPSTVRGELIKTPT